MEVKIFLRDINKSIAKAWKTEFVGYKNVNISNGDIFDIQADAIISPANSFGFMDGGIDLVYSYYFGWDLQKRLQEKIATHYFGELPVGMATIIETNNENIKYLISCPTMRVPENVSNTVNSYLAFRAGLIEIIKHNKNHPNNEIKSVLCPGLGTCVGRMSPEKCAKQMRFAYDSIIDNNYDFPKELIFAQKMHYEL